MATKAPVKKKNPRWVAVIEDLWANDGDGPATRADVMDSFADSLGFRVVKLTREQPVKK